jgi:peptide/nickel transport system permease protein
VKRTDPDSVAGDGFSFDAQTSSVEVTRGERLRHVYEEYVYKPALVAWDDWRTRIGAFLLAIYIGLATIGVWLYPAPSLIEDVPRGLQPFQNWDYPLGTTPQGQDVLGQSIHSTPPMLLMVVSGALFATGLAVIIGTLAGYKGGTTDRVLTSVSDVAMAIPGLPIVIVVAALLEPSSPLLIGVLIMVNYWAGLGRTLRSQILQLREESYVEASRAMGVSSPRIIFKDVLPNVMPYILVNFAFAARYVVFAAVGLYYLGVLPADVGNWGLQLRRAYSEYSALVGEGALYLILVPMIFIMFLGLSLVLLAQGLDRLFNPRVRTRLAGESESTPGEDDDTLTARGGI